MTLIEVFAALEEGSLPTNEQTLHFLDSLLDSSALKTRLLSPSGSRLIADVRELLETLKLVVTQRNGDEELQEFLWRTRLVKEKAVKEGVHIDGKGEDKDKKGKESKKKRAAKGALKASVVVKSEGEQALRHLRTLLRLMLVQPELRHILADVGYIGAQVVDKTTGTSIEEARFQMGQVKSTTGTLQNVATRALAMAREQKKAAASAGAQDGAEEQQSEAAMAKRREALKQLGNGAAKGMPALDDLRHQLRDTARHGLPSMDEIGQELQNQETVPKLEELKQQALGTAQQAEGAKQSLLKLGEQLKEGQLNEGLAKGAAEVLNSGGAEGQGTIAPTDLMDAAQMLAAANPNLALTDKEQIKRIAQDAKRDAVENVREAWTEERKKRLIGRLKKLCVDCQTNEQYKDALLFFIERTEKLASVTQKSVAKPSTTLDKSLSDAVKPLVGLIENFAEGRSLNDILERAKKLSVGARDDEEILGFWRDADALARRCLLEEGFAMEPEADRQVRAMIRRFEGLKADYKAEVALLLADMSGFGRAMVNDELLGRTLKLLTAILRDVSIGRDGDWLPSKALLKDLRLVILPAIFECIGVLPVPRVKYDHPDFSLIVENIALELKHLLPKTFDLKMSNDFHVDVEKLGSSSHAHQLKIKFKGMGIRIHDLAFAFTWKKGIRFVDKGVGDLRVDGFGLSIYIDVPKDPGPHFFVVKKVKAKLKTLKLKVRKSNHRLLHGFANAMANNYLTKRLLRHFIGFGVRLGLEQLDLALQAARLNRDVEQPGLTPAEVRRRIGELREALRKYHEMAGTLEIDFTTDEKDLDDGKPKVWEEAHAVRWVKRELKGTGRREIVRDRWRSSAFDAEGRETVIAPPSAEEEEPSASASHPFPHPVEAVAEAALDEAEDKFRNGQAA